MESMYKGSPTTPTARKTPATPTPSKARASGSSQKRKTKAQSESSPTPGQKRKMNKDVSPKNAIPKGKGAGARNQPGKKRKVVHEENETDGLQYSPLHDDPRLSLPTPYTTPNLPSLSYSGIPQQQQQYMAFSPRSDRSNCVNGPYVPLETLPSTSNFQQASSPDINTPATAHSFLSADQIAKPDLHTFFLVVNRMFTSNPSCLPQKKTDVIRSSGLDKYAYNLWEWCLRNMNGQLHKAANRYGAMMAEPKIRVLALLNLLPSWWFLRSEIGTWLQKQGWTVDDSDMVAQITEVEPVVEEIMKTHREHSRKVILAQQEQGLQGQQGVGNVGYK